MKKLKPIIIETQTPRDPNWKDLLGTKARPFQDKKKREKKEKCRKKVEDTHE